MLRRVLVTIFLAVAALSAGASRARAEPRLALVIGQGAYAGGELPTAVNDAGLVSQALTGAGFEVVQGRDLNQSDLRRIVRDFLEGVQTATPDASVVIYVAGHALQLEGENYLIPTDARIARESDIAIEGYRVSDILRSLSAAPGATRIVILDAARAYPLPGNAQGLAQGLALIEPPAGFLVAFSAAPSTIAPEAQPPYGAYATALVEMMREPGLNPDELFARVRLRVHEATRGRQTPWHAANLAAPFAFFQPVDAAAARPRPAPRRIASVAAEEAYAIAVEQDTIQAYQDFLRVYPDHPLARRVKVLLAARREAVIWRRTVQRNSPEAYWTYLRRYPRGPHVSDARRRLTRLSVPLAPPPDYDEVIYEDVPPPLPVEIVEVRETIYIEDDLPPPPRAPVYLLPERDEDILHLAPPPPAPARGILPIPIPIPIPLRARPPAEFRPPIAPLTPQGPVTIPVAPPPMKAVQGAPAAPAPQPSQAAPQSTQPGTAAAPPPGQPGLRGPIAPVAQQPQPDKPGAPAPGAATEPKPTPPQPAPAESKPAAAPSGPAAPTAAPAGRPASLPPKAAPGQPPTAGAPPAPAPSAPATRPGAIGASPPATPGAAPAQPRPPAPGAIGAQPAPPPAAPSPAAAPSRQPPAKPGAIPPAAGAPPGAAAAPQKPSAPAAAAPPKPAAPPAAAPVPMKPTPPAPAAAPKPTPAAPAPAAAPKPAAPTASPPSAAPSPRPAAPAARPPAPAEQPRPQAPAAAAPRPVPPPAVVAPKPAPPPVAAPPRPAAPPPPPAAVAPRPAPPPQAAPRPAPPPQGGGGGPQKCVLPNGQPCPPPAAR